MEIMKKRWIIIGIMLLTAAGFQACEKYVIMPPEVAQ